MRAFQPVHPRFEGAPGLENLEDKGVEEAMPKKKINNDQRRVLMIVIVIIL